MVKKLLFTTAVLGLISFPVLAEKPPILEDPIPVTVTNFPTPAPTAQIVNMCAVLTNTGGGDQHIYTVPTGMRLMLEYSSIRAEILDDGDIVQVVIKTTAAGVEGRFLVGEIYGSDFVFDSDGRTVKIYADAGTDVVGGFGSRNYLDDVEVCLSGKLSQ